MMKKILEVSGRVVSGMGRGRYFLSQMGYLKQMKKALSFSPYRGTLNIKVLNKDVRKIKTVRENKGIMIKGFKAKGKSFGDVVVFKSEVNGIISAVVFPKLSKYTDTIELISGKRLKDELSISDGDLVTVKISLK